MCAINGIVRPRARTGEERARDEELVKRMNAATAHRGPDATALWGDAHACLGHNRLAIIDLSPLGSQPMVSASGRTIAALNGEIYNYRELKEELGGYPFKSQSDTEVVLAAYERWGAGAFKKFRGMFVVALWDTTTSELVLARDQAGIKPAFWTLRDGAFCFSSELKGVLVGAELPRTINKTALKSFLRLRYVPGPETLVEGVHKLPASSYARVAGGKVEVHEYARVELTPLETKGRESVVRTIESLIDNAVKQELVSDRPVGLFLSGGLDSSVVLDATLKAQGEMETFSLRFALTDGEQAEKFNADAELAARTAKHYGTKHTEVLFAEEDFVHLLPHATHALDQPIGNATCLAQMYLARTARERFVVALMGDGGDELFGGYPRYRTSRIMDTYQTLPSFVRGAFSLVPHARKLNTPPGVTRIAQFMFEKDTLLLRAIQKEWLSHEPYIAFAENYLKGRREADFTQLFMDADRRSWLVDEALIRTDLMTMASALEARVPLLNVDLVEFASRLPSGMRVGKVSKALLREAFQSRLPAHVLEADKRGFFSPIAKWLRRPRLQEITRQTLSPGFHPGTDGLFNFAALRKLINEHMVGATYAAPLLWSLVSLRLWAKEYDATL